MFGASTNFSRSLGRTVAASILLAGLAASPAVAQRSGGGSSHGSASAGSGGGRGGYSGGGGYGRGGYGRGGYGRGGYGGGYGGGWGVGWGWGGYYPYWGGYDPYYYDYPYGYYDPGYPPPDAYPPAAAPEAAAPDNAAPAAAPQANSLPATLPQAFDLSVVFATGSAELTPEATALLDQLGQRLTSGAQANDRFRIEGHTDTVGSPVANLALSQQRADAVVGYLETKFNIPASRLEAVGLGENDLAVQTPDQTPELRNRRVHVVNLGAAA